MLKIGVLALQGAFIEHEKMFQKINETNKYEKIDIFEIRNKEDLNQHFDGLVLPGGESTTMGKLLKSLNIYDILKQKIENGLSTMGTCAGMILLSKKIINDSRLHFALMDIEVKRNAYGRQLGSFKTKAKFDNIEDVEMVFIRGPIVSKVYGNSKILSVVDNEIVAVRQDNMLALSYHPELTNDLRVHEYFIKMILEYKNK